MVTDTEGAQVLFCESTASASISVLSLLSPHSVYTALATVYIIYAATQNNEMSRHIEHCIAVHYAVASLISEWLRCHSTPLWRVR
jgi:hypothetical protein